MTSAYRVSSKVMFAVFGRLGKWSLEASSIDAYIASEDHRGTPAAPGRVVTLIEKSFWQTLHDPHISGDDDYVWGVAYHIIPAKGKEVQEYLDIREINGYSIQYTPFHPSDRDQPDIKCMVYIGMPDNPQFLGALDPQAVALKINESRGPSGENREYLLNLEQALLSLSADSHDEHISDLARRVREMVPPDPPAAEDAKTLPTMHRISSTEEQEEVEKDS